MDKEELVRSVYSSDDPFVQYYIVRASLNMSSGKLAAQVAHGAWLSAQKFYEDFDFKRKPNFVDKVVDLQAEYLMKMNIWKAEGYRKILLAAKDKEFERAKEELTGILVVDAGLTELEPGSETVYVLNLMRKSQRPNFLKRMRLLS